MDAEERGALIGTMEEEPVAEERRARAGAAGSEMADGSRRASPCDRRACTPQELLETLRPNLNPRDGSLREARARPGRSKVPWPRLPEMVTTGGMEMRPETELTEEQWSPGSFRNLETAVRCILEVPRYMHAMEKR